MQLLVPKLPNMWEMSVSKPSIYVIILNSEHLIDNFTKMLLLFCFGLLFCCFVVLFFFFFLGGGGG